MSGWGSGWWIVAGLFMLICMVMMARMMMGHGGHGDHGGTEHRGEDAEGTLANRLASGEIDVDEYERIRDTLRRSAEAESRT